ncbi:hypothetical protein NOF04DRAFT_3417 [Fusarium oxysporum II5]|uniref:BTB domain-containing protein n=1 Tax=Fusarium odoratissimum (strain NRRL 54006) TaxID=1089451 RepID=X0J1G9_FUSO5|nr:uncharacterized protein FOIG_16636 [Fusarium odoratissimum NRRL 54006]EXL90100.1 hypothetical protein FOIG_16636 [Fusarium odoratissimum NRRL 54006]KAK2134145.1 hypothetical protein NOF04DRAFT_3417 [Fusarium oxysporum II5]
MERVSKKAVATSKPFRFLIGPHQTEYTIHSALVAHQSPALAAMVNGKSQESRECSVKWDDVDEIVFNSFWQFVYTGDYDTPEPLRPTQRTSGRGDHKSGTADEPPEPEPEPEPEPAARPAVGEAELLAAIPVFAESVFSDLPQVSAAESEAQAQAQAQAEEESTYGTESTEMSPTFYTYFWRSPAGSRPSSALEQENQGSVQKSFLWGSFLRSWESPHEVIDIDKSLKDQTNRFVHHAKVFTLADRYGVKRLAEISRGKLYHDLIDLERKGMDSKNVVELVRYAFEELVPDQLRDLVVDFSACVVERIWGDKKFQKLLEKHGILSKALIKQLLLRLAEPPSRLYSALTSIQVSQVWGSNLIT